MENVENLLLTIMQGFVSNPDEVELVSSNEEDEKGDFVMLTIKVSKEDVGLCIGEKGNTAEALRRIIGLIGFKQVGKRVYVKVDAPKIR